jgi:hypothetical protein
LSKLNVDHVTIAGNRLEILRARFGEIGLDGEYGGVHSNRITHMDLLGFDHGSYIELISTIEFGLESPWWHKHIVQDAGPCAWAVQVGDIRRETERIASLGIAVRGPGYYQRERPDGKLIEWDLAFPGEHEPGWKLPFLISDRTPRALRVQASPSVSGSELVGVSKVILGVNDLSQSSSLFMHVYAWAAPEMEEDRTFGARLAAFPDQPVILAQPLGANWLQERLDMLGESPCAYLIASRDLNTSIEKRNLINVQRWFQQDVAWFDPAQLGETRLGVTAL